MERKKCQHSREKRIWLERTRMERSKKKHQKGIERGSKDKKQELVLPFSQSLNAEGPREVVAVKKVVKHVGTEVLAKLMRLLENNTIFKQSEAANHKADNEPWEGQDGIVAAADKRSRKPYCDLETPAPTWVRWREAGKAAR